MSRKLVLASAALLLLAACGNGRDPGYICMKNCDHFCQDGIKGDECRRQMQMQEEDRERESRYPRYYKDRNSYGRDHYYYRDRPPYTSRDYQERQNDGDGY